MTLRDHIFLTWNYGKAPLLVGGVYNLFCTYLQATGFSYAFFVDAFILKAVLVAITLYLVKQFRDRDAVFFYINLGLSRRKMLIRVVLAELYLILKSEAPFYILDEPFSQVDPVNVEAVQDMIRERAKEHGIIVTDHNYNAITRVTDNLFVIADGYTNPVLSREDLVRHGYLNAD